MSAPVQSRTRDPRRRAKRSTWRVAAGRVAMFAAAWWLLAGASTYGWPVALATVLAATLASLVLAPPAAAWWRPGALARFVVFFLWQSARGGVDVAARAMHPRLPIDPAELVFPIRLPEGPARTFFVAVVGLLPGTLSLEVGAEALRVHLLDRRLAAEPSLRRLEARVAELFGTGLRS
jgi:multicomponent Na+:H+ antiporter subunit E